MLVPGVDFLALSLLVYLLTLGELDVSYISGCIGIMIHFVLNRHFAFSVKATSLEKALPSGLRDSNRREEFFGSAER